MRGTMDAQSTSDPNWELLHDTVARLRASVMAIVFGLLAARGRNASFLCGLRDE